MKERLPNVKASTTNKLSQAESIFVRELGSSAPNASDGEVWLSGEMGT